MKFVAGTRILHLTQGAPLTSHPPAFLHPGKQHVRCDLEPSPSSYSTFSLSFSLSLYRCPTYPNNSDAHNEPQPQP